MDNPQLQNLGSGPHLAKVSSQEPGAPDFNRKLSPYPTLNHDLGEAKRKIASYAEIIRGEALAPSLWDTIFEPEVEKTVEKVFGKPYPRVLDGNMKRPIKWTDVLRESLKPEDFQPQSNGMYRCRVLGRLIEVSKEDYVEILTGVLDRLLQPRQDLSDEQKEIKVRTKLKLDIIETHNKVVLLANSIRESMQELDSPPIGNRTKHDSPPPDQSQLQTPVSPKAGSSCERVIYISDTEGDDEDSSFEGNSSNAAALTRRKLIETTENNSTNSMVCAPKELSELESSNAWQTVRHELSATNHDDAGLVKKNLSRAPSITLSNQKVDGKQAEAEASSPANASMRASNAANTNAALPRLSSRTDSRSASSLPSENPSIPVVANRLRYESPSATNNPVTADKDTNAKPSPYGLPSHFDAPSEPGSDIDTESVGSDIPYRIAESPASGSIAADYEDDALSSISVPVLPQKRRQDVSTSRYSAKKPCQGVSCRRMPKYTPLENSEGPEFVRSLIARGSTAAEIESMYNMRFGYHRSVRGLSKKFQINGCWQLVQESYDNRRRGLMST